jgi:hypothetical protein
MTYKIDPDTLTARRTQSRTITDPVSPDGSKPGEFRCPECKRAITRGESGLEYGHARNYPTVEGRCSRRPIEVDHNKKDNPNLKEIE